MIKNTISHMLKRISGKVSSETSIIEISLKMSNGDNEAPAQVSIRMYNKDDKSFETLIADIPELVLKEKYISTDVRPGRENDRWLNAIVIKRKELGHKSRC